MNNKQAAKTESKNATEIALYVMICSNESDEVDDISVYDSGFYDKGWGYH